MEIKTEKPEKLKKLFLGQPKDFYLTPEDLLETYRRLCRRTVVEDYKEGDSEQFIGYKQIFRPPRYRLGDNLFGFTEIGTDSISVRGDLKGEAYRRVKNHEMAHQLHPDRSESEIRAMTGTRMKEFTKLIYR